MIENTYQKNREIPKIVEFLTEWLEYAKSKDNQEQDEPYKFISYYIAFNYLYNQEMRSDNEYEFDQIKRFVKKQISDGFDPYRYIDTQKSEYLKKYVTTERKYTNDDKDDNATCNQRLNDIRRQYSAGKIELFRAIYRVRCNLFHGSKSLRDHMRNGGLIEDGSKVLKGLLDFVLEKEQHKKDTHN